MDGDGATFVDIATGLIRVDDEAMINFGVAMIDVDTKTTVVVGVIGKTALLLELGVNLLVLNVVEPHQ